MSIGVFLLDDHELVRRGIRDLLWGSDEVRIVGEASTAAEALEMIPQTRPDVAVLDVRLGDANSDFGGIEVCREIRATHPEIACIMLTSYEDDEALLAAILAGAAGFVLKQVKGGALLDAVKHVAAGGSLIDPSVTARVFDQLREPTAAADPLAHLTPQEKRILGFITEGLTNREIAAEMILSEKTVKNYVSNLLSKLGMARRAQAAAYAARILGSRGPATPN
jgi:DNA-binding NarL/FixJ family response regulator